MPKQVHAGEVFETPNTLFLGQILEQDGRAQYLMSLNKTGQTIQFHDSNTLPQDAALPQFPGDFQKILNPYEQKGGTCTAYAIYHFLFQSHLNLDLGNDLFKQTFNTEEGRTQLLADAINQYYLVTQHRFSILGILNQYGRQFGFQCKKSIFKSTNNALTFMQKNLSQGSPVLIAFNIGTEMYNGPFTLEKSWDLTNKEDNRLWIPRRIGERNSGGHSVVAVRDFQFNNKNYFIMLDSDWSLPRIWDNQVAINEKTDMDELEFYTCK